MTFDMNDVEPQQSGDLIPDGTFAKLVMTLRKGGTDGMSEADRGLLKVSNQPGSDVLTLDAEFTVAEGPHARRKFWQNFTVAGGKVDERGQSKGWNIAKSAFRAMIDSALGLDPKDESASAKQKRVIEGLKRLDGIVFVARIMIEPASNPNYKDANKLANVVTPDEPQYAAIMRGETVPPEPVNAKPRKTEATVTAPAWATPATAAPETGKAPWAAGAPVPAASPDPAPGAPAAAPAASPTGTPAWLKG